MRLLIEVANFACDNCISFVLLPGMTTQSRATLAIVYCLALFWMFLGMNIIADVFME